jgi:hypothetical protein
MKKKEKCFIFGPALKQTASFFKKKIFFLPKNLEL